MPLSKLASTKKGAAFLGFAAVSAAILVFSGVLAEGGPVIRNANPQGTVTSSNAKISLDTEDLARCKYDTKDTSYSDMGETLTSPDGLYHSASLGTLTKGSYTYYARCRDYEGNESDSSTKIAFKVGTISCVGDDCETTPPVTGNGPVLSGLLPAGTTYDSYVVLSVNTSEVADCRYSWYDKSFDSMTLQFTTSNRLYHTATAALTTRGYYTYYVRCRNDAGNVNAVAGKISFRYTVAYVAPPPPPVVTDSTPPAISGLSPYGDVENATATIACATDEVATCKYGAADADYDSLTDVMDADSGKTSHSKSIVLSAAGSYTYYVRCKDKTGNKNTASSNITFNYVVLAKGGPVISNLQPTGAIYQKDIGLIVQTDKVADCRYSTSDVEFDSMQDSFSTNDGQLQQATASLEDFGPYVYYVRCRDTDGNKNDKSEVINFEYKNPNPVEVVPVEPEVPVVEECTVPSTDAKDGECVKGPDKAADCICDPDCPVSGDDADPDCASLTPEPPNTGWIVFFFIGLLFIIIVVIIVVIIKRRNNEEEVELP